MYSKDNMKIVTAKWKHNFKVIIKANFQKCFKAWFNVQKQMGTHLWILPKNAWLHEW
jgi:hypothetical protein